MPRQFGMVPSECVMRGHITYFANSALYYNYLVSLDWCTYHCLCCVGSTLRFNGLYIYILLW